MVDTAGGDLWLDYLELCSAHGTLQTDLWVDGVRSTRRWRGAEGRLHLTLELHRPNLALGWYEGTCALLPQDKRNQTFVPC